MHGVRLGQATETSLRLIALQRLLRDLLYVIVEDHPKTRPDSYWNPFQYYWYRTGQGVLYRSTALPLLDYFLRPQPLSARSFICRHCELLDYRLCQLDNHGRCDRLDGITFGAPVATRCTVSWSQVRGLSTESLD